MATFGAKALTRIAASGQTDFDTAVTFGATTGETMFTDALGILDPGVTVALNEDVSVGKRTAIQAGAVVITGKNPIVTIGEAPISLRMLPVILDGLGATKSGATSPYTYTWSPAQGDVDTAIYYSMLMTDGVQKYKVVGAAPTEVTISADASGILQAGATFAAKSVATSAETFPTAINVQPMLAGRLMQLTVDTNFPDKAGTGAANYDYLMSFNLSVTTGLATVSALEGTISAATAAFTGSLDATLTLTVASNSAAIADGGWGIAEVGEQRYLRIFGTSGSPAYGVWILGSWVIESVTPLSAEQDGMVVNEVSLRLAYDTTSGKSLEIICDSPLAVAP
jgi:hypothetical protein